MERGDSDSAATAATTAIDDVVDGQWARLGAAGAWLTGAERVELIRVARDPAVGVDLDATTREAAVAVAHEAATITARAVDDLEAEGLARERYVEVVGVVSRVAAIDTYERGVGRTPREPPPVRRGEPSRSVVASARRRAGWVPTVGAIGPPSALTAVPAEAAAQEELHGVLYLSYAGMADLRCERGLTRAQMELVAARVSWLNDCVF
jgi:alkylhydroperoxidase family enzyme